MTKKSCIKDKNNHFYKINLFTCWRKKKCFTGACLSHPNLVNACYIFYIFYLQLNFNQCSHYITIWTHVGKWTWLLSGGLLYGYRPPMIDTVLLSWLHQVATVFKREWGGISRLRKEKKNMADYENPPKFTVILIWLLPCMNEAIQVQITNVSENFISIRVAWISSLTE